MADLYSIIFKCKCSCEYLVVKQVVTNYPHATHACIEGDDVEILKSSSLRNHANIVEESSLHCESCDREICMMDDVKECEEIKLVKIQVLE